jgi:hypothetical protein
MTRKRVIVISWDSDEQKSHFDMLAIDDSDPTKGDFITKGKAIISDSRQYAEVVDVLDLADIQRMATELETMPEFEILPFAAFVAELPRERCIELLTAVGIQCYDTETDDVLREAVRANLEDETIKFIDL